MRRWVVMKFGGTSVGSPDAMRRAAAHIAREAAGGRRPLVVVSALSGVTDALVAAATAARDGAPFQPVRDRIAARHDELLQGLALPPAPIAPLREELDRLLDAMAIIRARTPRVWDMALSFGERMAARLLAALLARQGLEAQPFDSWELGLMTDEQHGQARPLPEAFPAIAERLAALPPELIPVTTGYIGRSRSGEITTLGRGGSDYSAAIFGAAAQAAEIQIWTDVPGILRADPRVVPGAEVVPAMRFEEAAELAYFGAKVLHPRTIEPARRSAIPVRVLSTFAVDPAGEAPLAAAGTRIDDAAPAEPVRAIALRAGVQSLTVRSLRMLEAPGFLARIFEIFGRHGISIDVIATSEVSVSMTFDRTEGDLEAAVREVAAFADVERAPERSLLCLVGPGLRTDPSLLGRVFAILAARRIPLHVISQGASRLNLTVVTEPEPAREAMAALHAELFGRGGPG